MGKIKIIGLGILVIFAVLALQHIYVVGQRSQNPSLNEVEIQILAGDQKIQEIMRTGGIKFSGSLGGINNEGQYISTSVEGRTPQNYTFSGSQISLTIQKESRGELVVRIVKDENNIIAEQGTKAAYGVVTISTNI